MCEQGAPFQRILNIGGWGLAAILTIALAQGCKKPSSETAAPPPASPTAAPQPPAAPPAAPPESPGVTARITTGWTSGVVAFAPDHPVFIISRDYDQVLALPVRNLSGQPQKILATIEPWDEGMIGDFGGDGRVRPLEVPPGQTVSLPLQLYAQDAIYPSYRNTVTLSDAQSGSVLFKGPITVFVTLPAFEIQTTVGDQDPATLARRVTVRNTGQTITDFSVRPDGALAGHVQISPTVDHTLLEPGAQLGFNVEPVLDTDYAGLKGPIVLSGAGQTKSVDLDLPLPPGKHVFVATSFSTTNDSATGSYCTNNPNTNSPIGGPANSDDMWKQIKQQWDDPHYYGDGGNGNGGAGSEGKKSGDDDEGPFSNMANWLNSHLPEMNIPGLPVNTSGRVGFGGEVGPIGINGDVGATSGSDPTKPFVNANWNISVDGHTVVGGQTTVGISQQVQNNLNVNNTANPTGSQLSGVDYGQSSGSQGAPRGAAVREAYQKFRDGIFFDNEPEAMCDVSPGDPATRMIFQIWHSGRWTSGKGRQILLRIWDGTGKRALSRMIALSSPTDFCAWPTVLYLPDRAAVLGVWETTAAGQGPPTLSYRVGGRGFATWSPIRTVPGADSPDGNYDPQALMTPNGQVLILWQQGRDSNARLMLARSNDAGDLGAIAPSGLPPGIQRPLARFAANGTLCLVFEAPPSVAEPGVLTAVFAAVSHDGGVSFQNVTRLSPVGADAGEPDLLVNGQHCDAAYRVGPSWGSQICAASSDDAGGTWSAQRAVSDDTFYAEYPLLTPETGGVELSYYGDLRANRSLPRAGSIEATRSGSATTLKRFAMKLDQSGESPPRRLLTHFPSIDIAWLEVEFSLRFPRADFKPHDVTVLVNDHPVMHLHNAIPEGTYLVAIPPGILAQDVNGVPHNVIGLRTVHMNPGHYLSAAHFRLQARQAFSERLVVADSQDAADAAAWLETDEINHLRPDVGIFARADENPQLLPATPTPGQVITLPLTVANIGQSAAGKVKVRVYPGEAHLGSPFKDPPVGQEIDFDTLAPLDVKDLDVTFPYGGADMYSVVVSSDAGDPTLSDPNQRDFDLTNNVYRASFVPPQPPMIPPLQAVTGDFIADLDDDPAPAARWRIIDSQTGKDIATVESGHAPSAPIPPGKYQLALQRYPWEGKEITLPGSFERKAGQPLVVSWRTAIELQMPPAAQKPWQWEVVAADHPDQVVQSLSGQHTTMLLPPGDYFVSIDPTQWNSKWVRWPQRLHLDDGQHLALKIDSGVAIPDALAAQPPPSRWAMSSADDGREVQFANGVWGMMPLPPGKYLWSLQRTQWNSQTAKFGQPVTVEAGKITTLPVPARVDLAPSAWGEAPYSFTVYDLTANQKIASEVNGTTCWLPAGDYRLSIQPTQWSTHEITWVDKMHLDANANLKIPLDSGIDVEPLDPKEPGPYEIDFIGDGQSSAVQTFAPAQWGGMMLPPGRYHVAVDQRHWDCKPITWPTLLEVKPGDLARLTLDSGLRLTDLPADQLAGVEFQIISTPPGGSTTQPAAGTVVQTGKAAEATATVWIPPGIYSVQLRQGWGPWLSAAENVTVAAGAITNVKATLPPSQH